jgi:archaellum biogenesis protein FlaJ (TadC family)
MANETTLKDAQAQADRTFRRLLSVFLAIAIFIVGSVFVAGLIGEASVQANWVWAVLSAGGALFAFYAAQKDNRDAASGRISAVLTSTLKDYTVVAMGVLAAAALLATFGIAPFNVVAAAALAGLLAQFAFKRVWVPLK